MKKKNTWLWILIAVIVILAIVAILFFGGNKYKTTVTTQTATTGTVETTITATGEIQPVYKVEVGTQVSGIVKKLYVDYNSVVKRGDLLAELDKSVLQQQVKQSKAQLSTSQSNRLLAQKNFDRVKALYEKKAATQEEYDQAESELQSAKNQVVTAQSNYDNAVTNLGYAEIYSPIDGVVLSKSVEEGQTVASSFSTPTLFTIANNLTDMQVEADVDEADIGQVKVGQNVTFSVDAFPNDVFTGTVKQIRIEGAVTNNVVTYVVVIDAPNPEGKLYPGMTANVNIVVQKETGITIPLEATYFSINQETLKQIAKDGYTMAQPDQPATQGERPQDRPNQTDKTDNTKTIYLLYDKKLTPVRVKTSLDDGANIIVTEGLSEGDNVILQVSRDKIEKKKKNAADNPLQMGPPQKKTR